MNRSISRPVAIAIILMAVTLGIFWNYYHSYVAITETNKLEFVQKLFVAAQKGDYKTVDLIINRGVDIKQPSIGTRVLIEFVFAGRWDLAKRIIAKGAPADASMPYSNMGCVLHLIMFGLKANHDVTTATEIANLALAGSTKPILVDGNGSSPLHRAADFGEKEFVKLFLDHHMDVNAKDNRGRTPLFDAIEKDHVDVVKILIASGADTAIASKNGQHAIDLAKSKKFTEIVKYLNSLRSTRK